jgi:antitoxin (DNA-binding transcriptional repressor) of toxin-antitoxin stability system
MKTIFAATANRQLSSLLLREEALGERVTMLCRGKPVATMLAVAAEDFPRKEARRALLDRLSPAFTNENTRRLILEA